MSLAEIEEVLRQEHLFVSGIVHENLPDGAKCLLMVSPDEPGFWGMFTQSPEYQDGAADPMNRWTEAALARLVPQIAGACAFFPFGGPPWQPFIDWATRSGQAHPSPVGLMVHARAGLFISYRAAIALPYRLDLAGSARPCDGCSQPCLTACPVDAFAGGSYDVPKCKAHLETDAGRVCRNGCLVRRACPVGHSLRLPEQSAFHMEAFHPDVA